MQSAGRIAQSRQLNSCIGLIYYVSGVLFFQKKYLLFIVTVCVAPVGQGNVAIPSSGVNLSYQPGIELIIIILQLIQLFILP